MEETFPNLILSGAKPKSRPPPRIIGKTDNGIDMHTFDPTSVPAITEEEHAEAEVVSNILKTLDTAEAAESAAETVETAAVVMDTADGHDSLELENDAANESSTEVAMEEGSLNVLAIGGPQRSSTPKTKDAKNKLVFDPDSEDSLSDLEAPPPLTEEEERALSKLRAAQQEAGSSQRHLANPGSAAIPRKQQVLAMPNASTPSTCATLPPTSARGLPTRVVQVLERQPKGKPPPQLPKMHGRSSIDFTPRSRRDQVDTGRGDEEMMAQSSKTKRGGKADEEDGLDDEEAIFSEKAKKNNKKKKKKKKNGNKGDCSEEDEEEAEEEEATPSEKRAKGKASQNARVREAQKRALQLEIQENVKKHRPEGLQHIEIPVFATQLNGGGAREEEAAEAMEEIAVAQVQQIERRIKESRKTVDIATDLSLAKAREEMSLAKARNLSCTRTRVEYVRIELCTPAWFVNQEEDEVEELKVKKKYASKEKNVRATLFNGYEEIDDSGVKRYRIYDNLQDLAALQALYKDMEVATRDGMDFADDDDNGPGNEPEQEALGTGEAAEVAEENGAAEEASAALNQGEKKRRQESREDGRRGQQEERNPWALINVQYYEHRGSRAQHTAETIGRFSFSREKEEPVKTKGLLSNARECKFVMELVQLTYSSRKEAMALLKKMGTPFNEESVKVAMLPAHVFEMFMQKINSPLIDKRAFVRGFTGARAVSASTADNTALRHFLDHIPYEEAIEEFDEHMERVFYRLVGQEVSEADSEEVENRVVAKSALLHLRNGYNQGKAFCGKRTASAILSVLETRWDPYVAFTRAAVIREAFWKVERPMLLLVTTIADFDMESDNYGQLISKGGTLFLLFLEDCVDIWRQKMAQRYRMLTAEDVAAARIVAETSPYADGTGGHQDLVRCTLTGFTNRMVMTPSRLADHLRAIGALSLLKKESIRMLATGAMDASGKPHKDNYGAVPYLHSVLPAGRALITAPCFGTFGCPADTSEETLNEMATMQAAAAESMPTERKSKAKPKNASAAQSVPPSPVTVPVLAIPNQVTPAPPFPSPLSRSSSLSNNGLPQAAMSTTASSSQASGGSGGSQGRSQASANPMNSQSSQPMTPRDN